MNDQSFHTKAHRDIALRVALAARALPDTDPRRLLAVLDDCVGLPLTQSGIDRLSPGMLKQAAHGELSEMPGSMLRQAISFLKGELELEETPLPETVSYDEGDMPGSIRVACASNGGEMLDGHFGSCASFLIYQVSPTEIRLIAIRSGIVADQKPGLTTDRNIRRAEMISDCDILLVCSIGGPPAARATRLGVHPIKVAEPLPAKDKLVELQARLETAPLRWVKSTGDSVALSR